MRRISRAFWSFIIIGCLLLATPVYASDSKDKAIGELLDAMNTMDNMDISMSSMKDTMQMNSPYFLEEIKVILSRDLEDKSVRQAAVLFTEDSFGINRLYELFSDKFNTETVRAEIMLPIYREHYTEDEIRKLIDFYRSDLGKKTLRLTPVISKAISERTRDISHTALTQAKEELATELSKKLESK